MMQNKQDDLSTISRVKIPVQRKNSILKLQLSKDRIDQLSNEELLQEMIQICYKTKKTRSQVDLIVMKQYCQTLKFYQQFDQRTVNVINQHIQTQMIPKKRVLFRINTYGDRFYIVLKGSVKILIDDNPEKEKRRDYNGEVIDDIDLYQKLQKVKWTIELGVGHSFGELAIINNQKRQATIITSTDCVFGVLSKQDYKAILLNHEEIKIKRILNDVIGVKVFEYLEYKQIKNVCQVMLFEETYKWNQDVYSVGNDVDNVYIIAEGEYSVFQKYKNIIKSGSKDMVSFKRTNLMVQNYKCAILTRNQIFGYEEILSDQSTREYSVKCMSQFGRVYRIQKLVFMKDIYSIKSIQNYFDSIQKTKDIHRNLRMNNFNQSKSVLDSNIMSNVEQIRSIETKQKSMNSPDKLNQSIMLRDLKMNQNRNSQKSEISNIIRQDSNQSRFKFESYNLVANRSNISIIDKDHNKSHNNLKKILDIGYQ